MLLRTLFVFGWLFVQASHSLGQTPSAKLKPGSTAARALAFFTQIEDRSFDAYLKRIRLPKVSDETRSEARAFVARGEAVKVTDRMSAKLSALTPVLRYHERDSVIEVRVVTQPGLFINLQGRAMLLLSESALSQLTAEELQAAVAHELGHEYFWVELMKARQQKKHDIIREIELRCDGIAVIALQRLGLDPAKLVSALARMRIFNERLFPTDLLYHPAPDERVRFIQAMAELVQSKQSIQAGNQ